jgi:hypothetical protein
MNTIDNKRILTADLSMPRIGVWHASVEADGEEPLSGAVALDIQGTRFRGTVVRSDVVGGRVHAKVAGGGAGLGTDLQARHYANGPTVRQVIGDILQRCGESLSSTADATILGKRLAKWHRSAGTGGTALAEIAENQAAAWRVLPDGTVWVGRDTWPTLDLPHVLVDEDWIQGVLEVAPETAELRPATTFHGHRLSYVVHRLRASGLRSEAHTVDGPGNALERVLGRLRRSVAMAQTYPARVVSQRPDGTLELVPDDEQLKGAGLDRVPIRYGLPGCSAKVPPGTRVRVGFDGGDASRPFALGWDAGEFTELTLGNGVLPNARQGDMALSFLSLENLTYLTTLLTSAGGPLAVLPSAPVSLAALPFTISGVVSSGNPRVKS